MLKLEILHLGNAPCDTPAGITVNELIDLARLCPHLSELHFQAATNGRGSGYQHDGTVSFR